MKTKISPQELQRLLSYDPIAGALTWRKRTQNMFADGKYSSQERCERWNFRWSGRLAFTSVDKYGYKQGGVLSKTYLAHRVIWAIVNCEWPSGQIDHINGNKIDNRIVNLRIVNNSENQKNQTIASNNTSGFMGVSWKKATKKWYVFIGVDGKMKSLGYFCELSDAINARKEAEVAYGFHKNHGRTE